METWLPIPGYDGYDVSDAGRVRSWRRRGPGEYRNQSPAIITPTIAATGYAVVSVGIGKLRKQERVHRLVLAAFVGPCPTGYQACHWNGNRSDNRLSNLRWGTAGENGQDKVRHGSQIRGEHINTAKLTKDKVTEIRRRASEPHTVIARDFGVSNVAVRMIIQRKAWKHV